MADRAQASRKTAGQRERLNKGASPVEGDGAIVRSYENYSSQKVCTKCCIPKPLKAFGARKGKCRKPGERHAECKACTAARRKRRYSTEPGFKERVSLAVKKSYYTARSLAISHYGGRCYCCGEDNELFLTFDHLNNDGASHRHSLAANGRGASPKQLVQWIVDNNFPDTIGIACYNCNCARHHHGECPHKSNRKRLAEMIQPSLAVVNE